LSSGSTMADRPVPVRRRRGAARSAPAGTGSMSPTVLNASVRSSLDSLTKGPSQGAGVGLRRPGNPVVRSGGGAESCSADHDGVAIGDVWAQPDCRDGSLVRTPDSVTSEALLGCQTTGVSVSGNHVRGADTTNRSAGRCVADEHTAPGGASGAAISLTSPRHTAIPQRSISRVTNRRAERMRRGGRRSAGVCATKYPVLGRSNQSVTQM
jgi:hypothetical protein